ncbi:MAG: PQQ-dependent sugar dehydrogenase [Chloroflexi bacterium]|nr:PQQ-dependent sugar dehydrogenase [Chloroflexota bacterium]
MTALAAFSLALLASIVPAPSLASRTPSGPAVTISVKPVLSGFDWPVFATSDGDPRRLFIVEQPGRIRVAKKVDGKWRHAGVFLDIRDRVIDPRKELAERGLLGLAFHPDYIENGRFYVVYSRESRDPEKNADVVLAEFQRTSALRADALTRRVLLVVDSP